MFICEDWQFKIRWNAWGRFRYLSIRIDILYATPG